MKSYNVTIQMKATEQYFPVALFIMLCKVVLTFESMNEILNSCRLSKSNQYTRNNFSCLNTTQDIVSKLALYCPVSIF